MVITLILFYVLLVNFNNVCFFFSSIVSKVYWFSRLIMFCLLLTFVFCWYSFYFRSGNYIFLSFRHKIPLNVLGQATIWGLILSSLFWITFLGKNQWSPHEGLKLSDYKMTNPQAAAIWLRMWTTRISVVLYHGNSLSAHKNVRKALEETLFPTNIFWVRGNIT